MIRYQEFDSIPDECLYCSPEDLHKVLGGPSLIHIEGSGQRPIFISTLLHGNELTGILAIQKILRQYQGKARPARPITLLIGNTEAAAENQRFLPGQGDFNRIWNSSNAHKPGHLVERVMQLIRQKDYLICVDIHNNTGKNPLYSCVSRLDHTHLCFAGLFAPTCIYFTQPESTQTVYLSRFAPAITLECGHSAEPSGLDKATEFIWSILNLQSMPRKLTRELQIFHTVGRLRISPEISFRLADEDKLTDQKQLVLRSDLDQLNFSFLESRALLGTWSGDSLRPIVVDPMGEDHSHREAITIDCGCVYLRQGYYPSMFTRDKKVITQDCLGYLMEEIPAQDYMG